MNENDDNEYKILSHAYQYILVMTLEQNSC